MALLLSLLSWHLKQGCGVKPKIGVSSVFCHNRETGEVLTCSTMCLPTPSLVSGDKTVTLYLHPPPGEGTALVRSCKPQNYANILLQAPGSPLLAITRPTSPRPADSWCSGPCTHALPRSLGAHDCIFWVISSDQCQLLCWSWPLPWDRTPTSLAVNRNGSK